jgi:hypothetical protein
MRWVATHAFLKNSAATNRCDAPSEMLRRKMLVIVRNRDGDRASKIVKIRNHDLLECFSEPIIRIRCRERLVCTASAMEVVKGES